MSNRGMATSTTEVPSRSRADVGRKPLVLTNVRSESEPKTVTQAKGVHKHGAHPYTDGVGGGCGGATKSVSESSPFFTHTYDEFEPFEDFEPAPSSSTEECLRASPSCKDNDSDAASGSGERHVDSHGQAPGVHHGSTDEETDRGELCDRSSPCIVGSIPFEIGDHRQENVQDPSCDSPSRPHAAMVADQSGTQLPCAGSPGNAFSYPKGSPQVPMKSSPTPVVNAMPVPLSIHQGPPIMRPPPGAWMMPERPNIHQQGFAPASMQAERPNIHRQEFAPVSMPLQQERPNIHQQDLAPVSMPVQPERPQVFPQEFEPVSMSVQANMRMPEQATAHPDAAGGSIRLVKAVRPPAPLHHKKSNLVTSLTINHVPFQMRRTQLCGLIEEMGFAGRYNYLYVPCNHDKTNRGHAFINLCLPGDANDFFAKFHGARIVGVGNYSPVLSVAVSQVQGFEASIQRWTLTKLLSLNDPDFRPFIAGMTQ